MIPRIKGLRISNAREREHITGSEYIPFQDEDVNGKIKLSNLKDVSIYVFNPEVTDDWLNYMVITQEEYDALYDAIKNHKLIIVSPRVLAAGDWNVAHGQVMLNSNPCLYIPKFVRQEIDGTLARIEYYQLYFYDTRRLRITKYNTPSFLQNGNGKSILTDNGQYINIGDLALTNVVFEDGTNSCIYDLNSNRIVFGAKDTECVKFNTSKSDNTLNMKLLLAKATATMDGIMSKEDKVKLDTTLTEQITALLNAIAQEIQDRTNADVENARDIRNIIDSKGLPNGIAVLDASGKVPSEQLPSYVDDVIDVYAKYDRSATGDITNIKLYSDQTLTIPIAGVSDKIYVDKTPNKPSYTFRWSGTQFTHITSGGLILGTITGTAFDGGKGQTIIDGFINKIETVVEKIAMKLNGSSGVELDVTWGARTNNPDSSPKYTHEMTVDRLYLPKVSSSQAGLADPDMYYDVNTRIPNLFNAVNTKIDANKLDIASLLTQIGGLGYTHPAGTAANKSQGLYKFATDATSHISSVLAVVQKDITDLGIPSNTNLTDAINNAKNEVLTTINLQIVNLGTNLSPIIDSLVSQLSVLTNRVASLETQFSRLLDNFTEHVDNKNNPHVVTRAQLSLDTTNEVVFKKVTAINGFHKE